MMKRIFACSLAVLLCILPLMSCAVNKTLTVTSVDYPDLGKLRAVPADELTADAVEHMSIQDHIRGDDAHYY